MRAGRKRERSNAQEQGTALAMCDRQESKSRYGFFEAGAGFLTGGLVIVNGKMPIF